MDSMKASLRLMRSSRSISYWDLGATGMFDGILIDARGGFAARSACVRSYGLSQCPMWIGGARACRRRAVSEVGGNSQTVPCACRVRKCAVFGGAAEYKAVVIYRRKNWTLR